MGSDGKRKGSGQRIRSLFCRSFARARHSAEGKRGGCPLPRKCDMMGTDGKKHHGDLPGPGRGGSCMDYTQLLYFKTVARLGSVSEAAKELYVTQPNISRAISRLEDEMGVRFFDRVGGNRIQLNRCGEIFLERVERSFGELKEGLRELEDYNGKESGVISFALPQHRLFSSQMADYMKEHTGVKINQYLHSYTESKSLLLARKIDFAFSFIRPGKKDELFAYEPLWQDEIFLLVSVENPLAKRHVIDLREIRDERIAINNSCVDYMRIFEDYCQQAGFEPKTIFEGDDSSVMHGLLHGNYAVSPIPAILQMRMDTGNEPAGRPSQKIVPLRIKNPACRYELGIVTLKGHYLTAAARSFLAYLRTALPESFEEYRNEFYTLKLRGLDRVKDGWPEG